MKTTLKIDWATYKSAKYACLNWHYSKAIPAGAMVKIGVWEGRTFIGCIIFSKGANYNIMAPYGLNQTEGCELTRIALREHKSPVSRILKIALLFLKRSNPKLKLLVSYADGSQGHHGGIYQATNWIYTGESQASSFVLNGKKVHKRTLSSKFGKSSLNFLKSKGLNIKIVKDAPKHKYLLPLDQETKDKIILLKKPYPKREKQAMAVLQTAQRQGSTDLYAPS